MKLKQLNPSIKDFSFITLGPSDKLVLDYVQLGLEVEIEHIDRALQRRMLNMQPFWETTHDGSLKEGGVELRFAAPLQGADVDTAMELLRGELSPLLSSKNFTHRTSVHVHVDVARLINKENLNKFIALYCVFERALFRFAGIKRYDSIFCVPLADLWDHPKAIRRLSHNSPVLSEDESKYAALNLASIPRLGTVEFRHMSGTADVDRLYTWINLILSLYKSALDPAVTVQQVLQDVSSRGVEVALAKVFGELSKELLPHTLWEELFDGARAAQRYVVDGDYVPLPRGGVFGGMFSDLFGDIILAVPKGVDRSLNAVDLFVEDDEAYDDGDDDEQDNNY